MPKAATTARARSANSRQSRPSPAPAKKRASKRSGPAATGRKGPWSEDRKESFVRRRAETRAVREYLEALESRRGRGRRRTAASIDRQIEAAKAQMATASPVDRLLLIQRCRDLEAARTTVLVATDTEGLERSFIEVAGSYSERRGISYAAWREAGVSARVLRQAGIANADGGRATNK